MLNLTDREKIERFDLLQRVLVRCPVGWQDGRIIWPRSITQQDIVEWLCDVSNLVGIDEDGTAEMVLKIKGKYAT